MDKEEAERLVRAIRKAPVNWIQVSGVEQNPTTDLYEVTCEYKQPRDAIVACQRVLDDASDQKPPPVDRLTDPTRERLGTSLNTLRTSTS